jgi:hypothetical protein
METLMLAEIFILRLEAAFRKGGAPPGTSGDRHYVPIKLIPAVWHNVINHICRAVLMPRSEQNLINGSCHNLSCSTKFGLNV